MNSEWQIGIQYSVNKKYRSTKLKRHEDGKYLYIILRSFWIILSRSRCCQNALINEHCISIGQWHEWSI